MLSLFGVSGGSVSITWDIECWGLGCCGVCGGSCWDSERGVYCGVGPSSSLFSYGGVIGGRIEVERAELSEKIVWRFNS